MLCLSQSQQGLAILQEQFQAIYIVSATVDEIVDMMIVRPVPENALAQRGKVKDIDRVFLLLSRLDSVLMRPNFINAIVSIMITAVTSQFFLLTFQCTICHAYLSTTLSASNRCFIDLLN